MSALPPLNWQAPIVDSSGKPLTYFTRLWAALRGVSIATPAAGGLSGGGTLADGSISLSAEASAILDQLGSTQGSVLYRSATGWAVLGPGTAGQKLTTGGAGANPSWT